ncbi:MULTISPECIES: MATE family efflux transporter [Pelosinus]|uniref:Multidrug export protein MepA n=2 Tax=Pelosinus TaxID=365348 RepID=I9L6K7_9FIRM|nr:MULTISPECIES: MATE family efflux transporter [Pelosinus]EIW15861.1 MATE efflux family protein [Pelosinus fermentans B4]EIW27433.1 MATE efflux family protein [Pelosinus fermentans A11]OAM92610.1 MATE efflux family protein [Pelosinus fermentans DSM 17108]SDQ50796.1 putative efflux protein, MATE family [Pelosinus fermentans]
MDRSHSLGEEKISTLLWRFSLPAIIGMVVNAFYNVIDSIFVGRGVGEIGLTAVTIAFPIMIVLMGFGMLVGVGAAAVVSLRMGEKQQEQAEKILGNAFTLSMLLSAAFTGSVLLFLDPILIMLGAEQDVLPYAREFTRIIVLGSPFMYIGFGLNNIVRAEGNPQMAMSTTLISAGLNIVLNPLFIFTFHLGIGGSALATVISQGVSAIWVLVYFLRGKSVLRLRKKNFSLDKKIVRSIFEIGMSPFLMQIASSLTTVLFNYTLLRYSGELAVASIGIINRMGMLMLMPIFGISQGLQPIIGYNYGAGNYDRVKKALKIAIGAATLFSTVGFLVIQIFDKQIIMLFNDNPELILLGSEAMRINLCMLPVIGFQIIGANYFQAVGKAGYAIVLSMSRQLLLLIPLVLLLPRLLGLQGVWLASPIADFSSALLTGIFLFRELRKLSQK